MTDTPEAAIRATIDALVTAGTTADLSSLDRIYRSDMQVLMVDTDGTLARFDKPAFIDMLAAMVREADGPVDTWARYYTVDAQGDHGHVLMTRKLRLGGANKVMDLSIDLILKDGRWQVTREVIFARPDPDGTPA